MHRSSSVPQAWLAIVRQYGGDLKETYGVPVEEIQRGIKSGVRKVNIDTDIRLAMTGAMRQSFAQNPSEFDPRKSLIAARKAAAGICKRRCEAFGGAGMGSKIKPIHLDVMVARCVRVCRLRQQLQVSRRTNRHHSLTAALRSVGQSDRSGQSSWLVRQSVTWPSMQVTVSPPTHTWPLASCEMTTWPNRPRQVPWVAV